MQDSQVICSVIATVTLNHAHRIDEPPENPLQFVETEEIWE